MNTRHVLRLLAVVSLLAPGARLLANAATESDALGVRVFSLNLLEKDLRETAEREAIRANRKATPPPPSSLSAANFDVNKDGKLDEAEFAKWSAAVRAAVVKSPEAMKRYDTNKDGKLDDAEWAAASTVLMGKK
jgi:hypothetical protein